MENKNHPTIEEIIERYKDAEEVESMYDGLIDKIDLSTVIQEKRGFFICKTKTQKMYLYDERTQQYAKITKYKPEINLSKITPDLIRELNKDEKIHDILVKEGVVVEKPKPAYIQVPISEIDSLSSKKLGRFVKELASKY